GAVAQPPARALLFNKVPRSNRILTENLGRPIAAASHALGTGAPCTLFDLYVVEHLRSGEDEGHMDAWVRELGVNLDEDGRGKLREVFAKALRVRLPILRANGVF